MFFALRKVAGLRQLWTDDEYNAIKAIGRED
jgi:hypothetical protein